MDVNVFQMDVVKRIIGASPSNFVCFFWLKIILISEV